MVESSKVKDQKTNLQYIKTCSIELEFKELTAK